MDKPTESVREAPICGVWVCPCCGDPDIETECWVDSFERVWSGAGDTSWCPSCEDHNRYLCRVVVEGDGPWRCTVHAVDTFRECILATPNAADIIKAREKLWRLLLEVSGRTVQDCLDEALNALAEVHADELARDHYGDGDEDCSYCAIARRAAIVLGGESRARVLAHDESEAEVEP